MRFRGHCNRKRACWLRLRNKLALAVRTAARCKHVAQLKCSSPVHTLVLHSPPPSSKSEVRSQKPKPKPEPKLGCLSLSDRDGSKMIAQIDPKAALLCPRATRKPASRNQLKLPIADNARAGPTNETEGASLVISKLFRFATKQAEPTTMYDGRR